jgi:hypothetical protein
MDGLCLHLIKLAIASAITISVMGPQASCSSKGATATRDNGGTKDTSVTTGSIDLDLDAGQISAASACANAGNSPKGDCHILEMKIGTFIDAGDPPNGTLDCTELRNPVKQQGGPTTKRLCHDNYSSTIPGGVGDNRSGALVICAKIQCPEDKEPKQMQAIAWAGPAVKVPAGNDICDCFDAAAQVRAGTTADTGPQAAAPNLVGDWLNEPVGTLHTAGASFHIRGLSSRQLLQSCVVRTESSYRLFELSSHAGSGATMAVVTVYDGRMPVGSQLIGLPIAAHGRPTGSVEFPTSIERKTLVVQLYSDAMRSLGGYEVDL